MRNKFKPIQSSSMPVSEKFKNKLWGIVNVVCFRYTPSITGFFRKWRVILLRAFGANLSNSASIHPKARIDYPWRLSMGDQSSLGANSWAYCLDNISIGENSCIGENVFLLTGSHDISSPNFELVTKPINIGNGVWVATGSYVLPGVSLSDLSVVAANSTVVKSTTENDVVGGNPAKFLKKREIRED